MAYNQPPPPYYAGYAGQPVVQQTVTTVTTVQNNQTAQKPTYPKQGAAPPGGTVYVQPQYQYQSTTSQAASALGSAIGSAFRSGKRLANEASTQFVHEVDRYAESPLLDCFKQGSVVQLKSRVHNGCVRVLPDGRVDGRGSLGADYAAHFIVVLRQQNIVVLRNGANPAFHLAMLPGGGVGTGVGDRASMFRIHETFRHFLTLRQEMTGQRFAITKTGDIIAPSYINDNSEEGQFEVHLVYSPFGHGYIPTH